MTDLKMPTLKMNEPRSKEEWMAEIEEIIENGESCVTFICNQIALSRRSVEKYIQEMTKYGILQKGRRTSVNGVPNQMYVIAQERPRQKELIKEPPIRDWLVEAFFGEYKPCV